MRGGRAAIDAAKRLHLIVMSPAQHPDVQKLQDMFRDARLQCWQWLVGPEVPAENNRSEREVRPLATARKSSHGSQSDRGSADSTSQPRNCQGGLSGNCQRP